MGRITLWRGPVPRGMTRVYAPGVILLTGLAIVVAAYAKPWTMLMVPVALEAFVLLLTFAALRWWNKKYQLDGPRKGFRNNG